jgi:cytochrome c peroxidase
MTGRAAHLLAAILLRAMLSAMLSAMVCLPVARADGPAPPQNEPITPIPQPPPVDWRKSSLGAALFSDPRLSGNGRISCASCHDLRTNGASAQPRDATSDGSPAAVNTLTVFNAALNFRLTWKGSFHTLEEEAAGAIEAPGSMGGRRDAVVASLRQDAGLRQRFAAAYQRPPDWDSTLDAIAVFEKTLLTPGSPFDRWLQGDQSAVSADQVKGYGLFKSVGCVACHQGTNVGGNLFEKTGVVGDWPGGHRMLRVPSLRNVATTAPYFDDGSAATLNVAVRRMAAAQLGVALTDSQISLIVAFLNSLTGNYQGHPVTPAQ